MNKIVLITVSLMVLLMPGCSDGDARAKGDPTFMFWCFRKEVVSSTYHVPDMATSAAAAYLQNVLRNMPGYDTSTADLETRTITISYYSSTVRKMNFEETIALAGFAVNGRPANPEAEKNIPAGVK